jgi:hypothetical protein
LLASEEDNLNLKTATTIAAFSLLLIVAITAWGADVNVPCVDKSDLGSPLHSDGSAVLSQTISGNQVYLHYQDDWKTVNVSSKPVMAMVETISIRYPDGHLSDKTFEHESFFHPHVLAPGEAISLIPPNSGSGTEIVSAGNEETTEPACELTTRWAEYADGTSWGTASYATHLLQVRQDIWSALAHLNHIYQTQGADKFVQALLQPTHPEFVDGYIEHLRQVQKEQGTKSAIERLQSHLQVGEQRPTLK